VRHHRIGSRHREVAAATAILLLIAGATSVALVKGAAASPSTAAPAAGSQSLPIAPATTVPSALSVAFPALRGPATPLPAPAAALLGRTAPIGSSFGVNIALARAVPSSAPGQVWLLPGVSGMCIYESAPATAPSDFMGTSACGSLQDALSGKLGWTTTDNDGSTSVLALVPSAEFGSTVAITDTRGMAQTLTVPSGVFYSDEKGVASVMVRGRDGRWRSVMSKRFAQHATPVVAPASAPLVTPEGAPGRGESGPAERAFISAYHAAMPRLNRVSGEICRTTIGVNPGTGSRVAALFARLAREWSAANRPLIALKAPAAESGLFSAVTRDVPAVEADLLAIARAAAARTSTATAAARGQLASDFMDRLGPAVLELKWKLGIA
jgi:hypothetical protein